MHENAATEQFWVDLLYVCIYVYTKRLVLLMHVTCNQRWSFHCMYVCMCMEYLWLLLLHT